MTTKDFRSKRWILGILLLSFWVFPEWGWGEEEPRSGETAMTRLGRRALYVWNVWSQNGNGLIRSGREQAELLHFAKEKGIQILYLNAEGVVYGTGADRVRYANFIQRAHRKGVLVYALQGHPWWTVPRNSGLPGQSSDMEEGWKFVESVVQFGRFDGLIDDSEPYLAGTNDWWSRPEVRGQWLLDWLHGVRNRTRGQLVFCVTIPFWYDQDSRLTQLILDGSSVGRPLNHYVSDIVDAVNVMDYRDFAEGGDGMIHHASGELAYQATWISVETQFLGGGRIADKQTFFEEGESTMEETLGTFYENARSSRNFMGFSIHHYESYKDLAP